MEILPLNRERVQDANPTNEPFAMIGRLVPTYAEGKWRWTEPANKKSRGNEVKIGERRGEKKRYSKQIAAKASIKKSGSSTAC